MTAPAIRIRPEMASDWAAIEALLGEAFGGDDEAALVARLREEGLVVAALVAQTQTSIVGHVVLSSLDVAVDGRSIRAAALAPMAVRVDHQRRGVGSALVPAAIEAARRAGIDALVVVGHPSYYPRFGFSADLARKLASPFTGPALMALELRPGALSGSEGSIIYPSAFAL